MKEYEIRIFKDQSDYENRITCFVDFLYGSEEEAIERAKFLVKKFNVINWEVLESTLK